MAKISSRVAAISVLLVLFSLATFATSAKTHLGPEMVKAIKAALVKSDLYWSSPSKLQLYRVIGHGGQGSIYLAQVPKSDVEQIGALRVAAKLIPRDPKLRNWAYRYIPSEVRYHLWALYGSKRIYESPENQAEVKAHNSWIDAGLSAIVLSYKWFATASTVMPALEDRLGDLPLPPKEDNAPIASTVGHYGLLLESLSHDLFDELHLRPSFDTSSDVNPTVSLSRHLGAAHVREGPPNINHLYGTIRLVRAIVAAIFALNQARPLPIVHRDIKPENILLKKNGCLQLPKIADMGLSTFASTADSSYSTNCGSLGYLAPETLLGMLSQQIRIRFFKTDEEYKGYYIPALELAPPGTDVDDFFESANAVDMWNVGIILMQALDIYDWKLHENGYSKALCISELMLLQLFRKYVVLKDLSNPQDWKLNQKAIEEINIKWATRREVLSQFNAPDSLDKVYELLVGLLQCHPMSRLTPREALRKIDEIIKINRDHMKQALDNVEKPPHTDEESIVQAPSSIQLTTEQSYDMDTCYYKALLWNKKTMLDEPMLQLLAERRLTATLEGI